MELPVGPFSRRETAMTALEHLIFAAKPQGTSGETSSGNRAGHAGPGV